MQNFPGKLGHWRLVPAMAASAIVLGLWLGSVPAGAEQTGRDPEHIYRTTCGYCHGHNVGPIIRGRKLPTASIEYFVRNGNAGMPAFKPTEISPAELAALARWINQSQADPKEHGQ